MGNFKWCGNISIQHGGSQISGWWFDKYMQNVTIHVDDLTSNISYNSTYTLSYICLGDIDVDKIIKQIYKAWV